MCQISTVYVFICCDGFLYLVGIVVTIPRLKIQNLLLFKRWIQFGCNNKEQNMAGIGRFSRLHKNRVKMLTSCGMSFQVINKSDFSMG
jgi:hypothetical protein